ncbi:hypothetical protein FS749_015214 [Ceratobasidium sp. UAMH 11750]|nr:hypothetical protein FS749_015214 [Ceratobasidium sp. UAMH 11750]
MVVGLLTQHALDPAAVSDLFPEQLRAFNIVRGHLGPTLEAIRTGTPLPPQLLMLLVGKGGMGKSKVIQTITAEFERRGVVGMLIKAAYTGIAALLIQDKTTHNIGCISVGKNTLSDSAEAKLARIWRDVRYLIIDEYSMLPKEFWVNYRGTSRLIGWRTTRLLRLRIMVESTL